MNIFGCALQYCYIKFMLKVTKAWATIKNYNKSIKAEVTISFEKLMSHPNLKEKL